MCVLKLHALPLGPGGPVSPKMPSGPSTPDGPGGPCSPLGPGYQSENQQKITFSHVSKYGKVYSKQVLPGTPQIPFGPGRPCIPGGPGAPCIEVPGGPWGPARPGLPKPGIPGLPLQPFCPLGPESALVCIRQVFSTIKIVMIYLP